MLEILQSETFSKWLDRLDRDAQKRVVARIRRFSLGNPGEMKLLRGGICEMKIDFGPGYRVYYKQRAVLVLLLVGGDKRTQDADIKRAIKIEKFWKE